MGQTFQVDRAHPRAPLSMHVTRDGGITGLTVEARIGTGVAGEFLDFSDLTFKAAGHVTPTVTLPEVDAGDMPGWYAVDGGFDVSTIVNLAAAQLQLWVHLSITAGGESGDDVDVWQFSERPASVLLDTLNRGADHNIKDSVAKQIRQGSTGGLDIEAKDVVSAAATTIELDASESTVNGFLARRYVAIVDGLGSGQVRAIASYVGATRVATITRAWTTVPDATSDYILLLSSESELTGVSDDRLRYVHIHTGAINGNKMNHTTAIVGTPGRAFSDDLEVDQVVTQVDADTATFEQVP